MCAPFFWALFQPRFSSYAGFQTPFCFFYSNFIRPLLEHSRARQPQPDAERAPLSPYAHAAPAAQDASLLHRRCFSDPFGPLVLRDLSPSLGLQCRHRPRQFRPCHHLGHFGRRVLPLERRSTAFQGLRPHSGFSLQRLIWLRGYRRAPCGHWRRWPCPWRRRSGARCRWGPMLRSAAGPGIQRAHPGTTLFPDSGLLRRRRLLRGSLRPGPDNRPLPPPYPFGHERPGAVAHVGRRYFFIFIYSLQL